MKAFLALLLLVPLLFVSCSPASAAAPRPVEPDPPALQLVGQFCHGPGTEFVRPFQLVSIARDLNDPTLFVVSIFDGQTNVQFRERYRATITIGQLVDGPEVFGGFDDEETGR
jgi:hypothetical protein